MTKLADYLRDRLFKHQVHPYRIFEHEIEVRLQPECTILDIGCGRTAPTAAKFLAAGRNIIGIDIVDLRRDAVPPSIHLVRADASKMPIQAGTVDVAFSRSVFEHLEAPEETVRELCRVLKPGGHLIVLTPNKWDYASIIARIVPNRFHGRVVNIVEGRAAEDVFPTKYLFNTRADIERISKQNGFDVVKFEYMSQYPNYFLFNGFLFFIASMYHKFLDRLSILRYLKGWILVTLRHKPQ